VAFLGRDSVDLWLAAAGSPGAPTGGDTAETPPEPGGSAGILLAHLRQRGASFWREILRDTGLSAAEAREGIAELTALGWLTSDGFRGLRSLIQGEESLERAGRWSLLRPPRMDISGEKNPPSGARRAGRGVVEAWKPKDLETLARVLLRRYGVVFRKLADRENLAPPWRDLVRALRVLEARGEVRGGRFVEGFYGEQFALPEAVGLLRKLRKQEKAGTLVSLCAADPANLQGILTPGPRVPATRKNRILYRDGYPLAALEGGEVKFLQQPSEHAARDWEKALRQGLTPSGLEGTTRIAGLGFPPSAKAG
jgi:ATP-dependent Lhr-like helicase